MNEVKMVENLPLKREYGAPKLTVIGNVKELTLAGASGKPENAGKATCGNPQFNLTGNDCP